MSYKVIPLKPFLKFYKLRNKKEKDLIDKKIYLLELNPYNNQELDIKKLKGYEKRYRLRVKDFRIIYEVFEERLIIILADAGNRGDIYK